MKTHVRSAAALLLLAGTAGCASEKPAPRHFHAPAGIAVGPSGDASPPHLYGFVADPGSFSIRRIDLDRRELDSPRFPVGRTLGTLAAHVDDDTGTVDALWGIDVDLGQLVRIDTGRALDPVAESPEFQDVGPTSDVALTGIDVDAGETPTQTWTVAYRETIARWEVHGSGTGIQKRLAKTGDRYRSDKDEVSFLIRQAGDGPPTEGDTFTFVTDNGVEVANTVVNGRAVNVVAVTSEIGIVSTENTAPPKPARLVAFDLATGETLVTYLLPNGTIPAGMELSPDGTALYVADMGSPTIHRLSIAGAPEAWTVDSLDVPVPMRDVAVSGDGTRVHLLAADAEDVFVHLASPWGAIDAVGSLPGVDPVRMPLSVRAIAGARRPHVMKGSGVPAYPVLVSTHGGGILFLNGATGCVDYVDSRGPRLTGSRFRDSALPSAPTFVEDAFEASPCGGRVLDETWTLVFNGALDAWEVTGSLSGKQVGVLVEGTPYTTDGGELTMRIDGSPDLPTDDGDTYFVSVTDGVRPLSVGSVPERAVFFTRTSDDGEEHEYALVSNVAGDSVSQINVGRRKVVETYR